LPQCELLLDLEGILIPSWGDWFCPPGAADRVQAIFDTYQPDSVKIFSYAIAAQDDALTLKAELPYLCEASGLPISDIWLLDDVRRRLARHAQIHVASNEDLVCYYTKESVLFALSQSGDLAPRTILVDDNVREQHWSLASPEQNVHIIRLPAC